MNRTAITVLLTLFAFVFMGPGSLRAENPQPRMNDALTLLESARDSDKPEPLLKMARQKLSHARPNKGGRRADAINAIDDALKLIAAGKDPKSKITHAITMVKAGIEKGE